MSINRSESVRSRRILAAVINGVAAALGYLIAELIMQHDTSFVVWGMLGVFAAVAVITYLIDLGLNRRR